MMTQTTSDGGSTHGESYMVAAEVVRGHCVASGTSGDSRFPGGTIRMQLPFFMALGLDLSPFHPATVNVDIAPCTYRVAAPRYSFRQVAWHPTMPPEDFSFFNVEVLGLGPEPVTGFIYYPHPETKPCHFQKASVLELLLPFVPSLSYGMRVQLRIPVSQMTINSPS